MALQRGIFDNHLCFKNSEGRLALFHMVYDYEYIVDYHPYHGGNNPKFDENSNKILRFKDGMDYAVEYFENLINQNYNSNWDGCYCVAVPSHDPANNYSPIRGSKISATYDLIARLVNKHNGLHNGSAVLIRTQEVPKKSFGGSRDISTDLNSVAVNRSSGIDITGKNILLIDDVTTTGNSIAACKMILKKGGANKVFVLCLAKTARDPYESQSESSADVPFDEEVPF